MQITSHRLRTEEKKLVKKLLYILVAFFAFLILIVYTGLPLLAKFIVAITSINQNPVKTNQAESLSILFPPVLDRIAEATNSATVKISGSGNTGATVKIYINNQEVLKVLADKEGRFQTGKIQLNEGNNTFTAINVLNNQESSPSAPMSITYKKSPPSLQIETPKDGDKFSSDNKDIYIQGLTDPGNRVIINDRQVIVDREGKFKYPVTLSEGDNIFHIIATDDAGNQTKMDLKVSYTK